MAALLSLSNLEAKPLVDEVWVVRSSAVDVKTSIEFGIFCNIQPNAKMFKRVKPTMQKLLSVKTRDPFTNKGMKRNISFQDF